MGDRRDPCLYFALTRDVALGDVVHLRDLLLARGHDVRLLERVEGGIEFGGCRSIRWQTLDAGDSVVVTPAGTFKAALDTVIIRHVPEAAYWDDLNQFAVEVCGAFTAAELADVCDGLGQCLGLLENTIHNRGGSEADETVPEVDANIFAGFAFMQAVRAFTTPQPLWPDAVTVRLFECWRCGAAMPHSRYATYRGRPTFCGLLRQYVMGDNPCCVVCQQGLIYGRGGR